MNAFLLGLALSLVTSTQGFVSLTQSPGFPDSRTAACADKMYQIRSSAMASTSFRRILSTSRPRCSVSSVRTLGIAAPLEDTAGSVPVKVYNPEGAKRVVVTKPLPGDRWLECLIDADARVEVCALEGPEFTILTVDTIKELIGNECSGAIGQLTENWGDELLGALAAAGGKAFSNYAVGYDNVDIDAATKHGIPVGNTPGISTQTVAEAAAGLTLTASRRLVEADTFLRSGHYRGWLPKLFLGHLLHGGTVGIVGAGRIGQAYARMMVEGHKMNVVYYNLLPQPKFEAFVAAYSDFLVSCGEKPVTCTRASTVDELLPMCDVVSLHTPLNNATHHLINEARLKTMRPDAVLINTGRGACIDESALVKHLKSQPSFSCGLDVFERGPKLHEGLADCANAVVVPHIASASLYTRIGMATLAACNIAGILRNDPVWDKPSDVEPFLETSVSDVPHFSPSIVNANELNLK